MVRRFVFIKLADGAATPERLGALIARAHSDLPEVPGVRAVRAGQPADEASRSAWDLVLIVSFDRIEDVEPYRVHPRHRAFVDEAITPDLAAIKAWNFEVDAI